MVYSGPVIINVNVPGSPTIKYLGGSVTSVPAGATSGSPTGNSVAISVPLPPLGKTTEVKFVVRADCDVLKLNPLPQFTGTVTYPTPYPVASETISSAPLSVGNAQLNVSPIAGNSNQNLAFGTQHWLGPQVCNSGYGSIDNVKVTIVSSNDEPYNYFKVFSNGWVDYGGAGALISTTPLAGNKTERVYLITGGKLGADKLLTPGECLYIVERRTTPQACGQYDSQIKVEYTCAGGGTVCDKPQTITDLTTVSAGTPKLAGTLNSVEYPDGCPKKKISYTVTNTATGNGAPVGNAYDVKLGINLGTGKANLTNVQVNGVPVTVTGGLTSYTIDPAQLTAAAGGLTDLDGDGKFDDMAVGAAVTITFEYSIPCDLACGADLDYNFSSSNTFTDFCRTLNGSTSTPLATFGFAQVQPIIQDPKVDYGILTTGQTATKTAKFTFQYKATNIDVSAGTAQLCISYSRTMELDYNSVKLNGQAITGTVQGTGATVGGAAGATDNDSVWVHTLTAAEVAALFDGTPDALQYDQTFYGCDERQKTKATDSWQLKFRAKAGNCSDGSTPCTFDLACKKAYVYGFGNACGVKPCWVSDSKFFRITPTGYTDATLATKINPIDSTRAYECDTVEYKMTHFFAGNWATQNYGYYKNPLLEPESEFTFQYSIPAGSVYNGVSPWNFLPSYSKVCVRKRTPDPTDPKKVGTLGPVIFEAPLLLSDFQSAGSGTGYANSTTTTPVSSTVVGYDPVNYPGAANVFDYYCNTYPGNTNWYYNLCPYSTTVEYGSSAWYNRTFNTALDKANETYYLSWGTALARAGYNGPINADNYYVEVKMRWKMNETFPWDNSNSISFKGEILN